MDLFTFYVVDTPPKPAFVPIAFQSLDWNAHSHIRMLASAVNFITHKGETLFEGDQENTLSLVSLAIQKIGIDSENLTQSLLKRIFFR